MGYPYIDGGNTSYILTPAAVLEWASRYSSSFIPMRPTATAEQDICANSDKSSGGVVRVCVGRVRALSTVDA